MMVFIVVLGVDWENNLCGVGVVMVCIVVVDVLIIGFVEYVI